MCLCEGGSPGGGSGDMTSDITTVTADGATSGAPCVRPGRRQAVCAHGERCGSPARHPHRRRDVRAHVHTYGLTDVIDPGGNTGELSPLSPADTRPSCARWPGSQPVEHTGSVRHSVVSSHGTSTSNVRLIGRQMPVPSSGLDPYIPGHRSAEATLIQLRGGGPGGRSTRVCRAWC